MVDRTTQDTDIKSRLVKLLFGIAAYAFVQHFQHMFFYNFSRKPTKYYSDPGKYILLLSKYNTIFLTAKNGFHHKVLLNNTPLS